MPQIARHINNSSSPIPNCRQTPAPYQTAENTDDISTSTDSDGSTPENLGQSFLLSTFNSQQK